MAAVNHVFVQMGASGEFQLSINLENSFGFDGICSRSLVLLIICYK